MPEIAHPLIVIALLVVAVIASELTMRRQLRRGVEGLEASVAPDWLLHHATGVFQDRRFVVEYNGTARPVLHVAIERPSPHRFKVVRRTFLQSRLGPKHQRPFGTGLILVARREEDAARGGAALDDLTGRQCVATLFDQYGADSLAFNPTMICASFVRHGRRVLKTEQVPHVLTALSESAALLERSGVTPGQRSRTSVHSSSTP